MAMLNNQGVYGPAKKSLYPIQTGIWTVEIGIEPSKIVIEPEKNQRQEIKKILPGTTQNGANEIPSGKRKQFANWKITVFNG